MQKDWCVTCGCRVLKVIHCGMPMRLCSNEQCSRVAGFWSWTIGGLFPIYWRLHGV